MLAAVNIAFDHKTRRQCILMDDTRSKNSVCRFFDERKPRLRSSNGKQTESFDNGVDQILLINIISIHAKSPLGDKLQKFNKAVFFASL